jgi:hypothetical protein
MEQKTIERYVLDQLNSGENPDSLIRNLTMVGWSEAEAKAQLANALIARGVPAPSGNTSLGGGRLTSTVEVVLNFFSFILLGIVASAFGVLYYQIINAYFPDPLRVMYGSYDASRSAMHYAMAALLIGFPLYVLAIRLWFRRFLAEEDKIESKLSKWLTYIVLLVAAVTIVGDLITSIFFLLQGEVTLRFFLKALTILVVAGIIFGFYFMERRVVQYKEMLPLRRYQGFLFGVSALVLVGLGLGFVVGGSPSTERMRGLDSQRAQDLMSIAGCVGSYGVTYKRLPDSLDELNKSSSYTYCGTNIVDPETGVPYEYIVTTPSRQKGTVTEGEFELCADFTLSSEGEEALPANSYSEAKSKWSQHGVGRSCDAEVVVLESALAVSPEKGLIAPTPIITR